MTGVATPRYGIRLVKLENDEPYGVISTYENMELACHELGGSHERFHTACDNNTPYLGFRWRKDAAPGEA